MQKTVPIVGCMDVTIIDMLFITISIIHIY